MQGRAAQTTGAAAKVTTGQLDVGQARMQFEDAQKAMQQGDWDKIRQGDGGAETPIGQPANVAPEPHVEPPRRNMAWFR